MTFRGEEVKLPKSVSHFELNDRATPNQGYGPSRYISYDNCGCRQSGWYIDEYESVGVIWRHE